MHELVYNLTERDKEGYRERGRGRGIQKERKGGR